MRNSEIKQGSTYLCRNPFASSRKVISFLEFLPRHCNPERWPRPFERWQQSWLDKDTRVEVCYESRRHGVIRHHWCTLSNFCRWAKEKIS